VAAAAAGAAAELLPPGLIRGATNAVGPAKLPAAAQPLLAAGRLWSAAVAAPASVAAPTAVAAAAELPQRRSSCGVSRCLPCNAPMSAPSLPAVQEGQCSRPATNTDAVTTAMRYTELLCYAASLRTMLIQDEHPAPMVQAAAPKRMFYTLTTLVPQALARRRATPSRASLAALADPPASRCIAFVNSSVAQPCRLAAMPPLPCPLWGDRQQPRNYPAPRGTHAA